MPLGIRPINDFAFKKTFGTPENRVVLISLLNAILQPKEPIVEVPLRADGAFGTVAAAGDTASDGNAGQDCPNYRGQSHV